MYPLLAWLLGPVVVLGANENVLISFRTERGTLIK
jgi:hypothetical protein